MQKIITKINYYSCGYCVNNLKTVFKKTNKEKRRFPAGVFLIKHKSEGYILFDTGYSKEIYSCGVIGKLYNLFNPTFVKKEDVIDFKLHKDKIDPNDIKYIILSHLHPDHIGGLKKFKNSKIIITDKTYKKYLKPKVTDLIIKKMIPNWFEKNLIVIKQEDFMTNKNKYFNYFDLFNDKSILLTNLDGHAYGQLCALISDKYFLGADTCWGTDLIEKITQMKFAARLIQNNYKKYIEVSKILKKLQKDKIILLFSHDKYERKEILNNE